jgi:hypothetical protein
MGTTTLKKIISFILIIILLISCNWKLNKVSKFAALKFTREYQIVLYDGTIPHLQDTVSMIFFKNYNLFSIPYTALKEKGDSLITDQILYDNFLFKNSEKEGYFIFNDSLRGIRKASVDSILSVHCQVTKSSPAVLNSLIRLPEIKEGSITIWKFALPNKHSEFILDTAIYYFDRNLVNHRFSLWKGLDSISGSKLFKTRFLYNSKWSDTLRKILPAREDLVEFHIDSAIKEKKEKNRLDSLLRRVRLKFPNDNLKD